MCDTFSETDVFLLQSVLPNEPGCFTWARTTHSLWEAIRKVPENLARVQLQFGNISFSIFTYRERLIRNHSSARFSFELSGNSN